MIRTKCLFLIALIFLSGCDGKNSSFTKVNCESIKESIIEVSNKVIIEITEIKSTKENIQPLTIKMPGKIILACEGVGFLYDGQSKPLNFFMSETEVKKFYGYEIVGIEEITRKINQLLGK